MSADLSASSAPTITGVDELAEVLRAHRGKPIVCECGEMTETAEQHRRHVAEVIAASGVVPVAEVREREAAAWDQGMRTGTSRAMRHMSDEPDLPLASADDNPFARLAGRGAGGGS